MKKTLVFVRTVTQKSAPSPLAIAVAFLVPMLICGCGGGRPIQTVQGKVTLGGKPLQDATVSFLPSNEMGEFASARTDAGGVYRLTQTEDRAGVPAAKYEVRITTFEMGNPDDDPPQPLVAEKVPAKYNVQTELSVEVVEGENTFDFELKADGPILQPDVSTDDF